jgi:hypothetical protein
MRILGLSLVLVPSIVFAQTPPPPAPPAAPPPQAASAPAAEPSECTVTTTVRCTGAAAPYAVQAAQPEPVVVPMPALPPPPPVAAPPPPPAPAPIVLDPRQLRLGGGWRLVQSPDGCLWRERKVSTDAPAVWGTGMAFWLVGYGAAIVGGMQQGGAGVLGWWPFAGAFINSAFTSGTPQVLWVVDGLAQVGGFVTFIVGMAAGPDKIERRPITISPTAFVGGGQGVALSARF